MPKYTFQCNDCGHDEQHYFTFDTDTFTLTAPCPYNDCDGEMKRVISSPHFKRGLPDHFNNSTGSYVSGERQLRSELSRLSDAQSLRTGVDHNYKWHDGRDKEFFGVTDEGMDATRRREVREGKREVTRFM